MAVTSSLTKAWETKILKMLAKGEAPTLPSALYVALYTATPSRTAAGTEANYTGYARVKVEFSKWEVVEATGAGEGEEGYFKNSEEIKFPECTAGSNEVESVAICTKPLGEGEEIVWGKLEEKKTISTTNTPASFAAGALKYKLS